MEFQEGWLRRQIERAQKEIESWSPEKKAIFAQVELSEPISEEEYWDNYRCARMYGNY